MHNVVGKISVKWVHTQSSGSAPVDIFFFIFIVFFHHFVLYDKLFMEKIQNVLIFRMYDINQNPYSEEKEEGKCIRNGNPKNIFIISFTK